VVAGQLERSGGGRTFVLEDKQSFIAALKEVGERRAELSKKARRYAARFRWQSVVDAYLEEIARLRR
jgi:glycosyltransferase involved in cell wall biosynthesis